MFLFMEKRIEKDSFGNIDVPKNVYYGAQTMRALNNFQIGTKTFPIELIEALALVKKSTFQANDKLGQMKDLSKKEKQAVITSCDEIISGKFKDEFPLSIWQSGSGTQTHMNVIEVIKNRANEILMGKIGLNEPIHPNDHINRGQSTNDVFPTAMHIATVQQVKKSLIPALKNLSDEFKRKEKKWHNVIKIGRTHLQDATPLSVGQELSAYIQQIDSCILEIENNVKELFSLPLGGTAVGTGLNTIKGYDVLTVELIAKETSIPFKVAKNKFALISAHDGFVSLSSSLKRLAVVSSKIANDIRLLGSGPNCGIGELILPENEPGSSIMPGKVNPTQCEALSMISARVIGNDTTITIAGSQGHLQLNTQKPVIVYYILESIAVLADGINSFNKNCILGMDLNRKKIAEHVDKSLMLVTALNEHIGYEKAAKIAQIAYKEDITLKQATLKLKYLTEEEFDKIVCPKKMI